MSDATFELPLLSVDRIADDVVLLSLDGAERPMRYREGQFVVLELPGGQTRSYSLAQPCWPDGRLELHIRLRREGQMSRRIERGLAPGDTLRVHGPYGECVWRPAAADEPVVMLATGTGIAPLQAMLMRELASDGKAPISLYWGARTSADLYLMECFERLARIAPRFSFVPVLSRPEPGWRGARGHVQQVAIARHPDLRKGWVYACGTPAMVRDARALLGGLCGLPAGRFVAEAFEPAVAPAPAPLYASSVCRR
jgi:CDP-4-dehydro-6-deoxyglucose reductase